MADQHRNQNRASFNQKSSSSIGDWLLPMVFLFILPPVGVVLLLLKLFGIGASTKNTPKSRSAQAQDIPSGARTSTAEFAAAPKRKKKKSASMDPLAALASRSKKLNALGGFMTILFSFCTVVEFVDCLWMLPDVIWLIQEVLPLLCFAVGGACAWLAGRRLKKKVRRYRQYLATIGTNQIISISALATATGRSAVTVREDLQDMLDDGLFPTGFLDYGGDQLVLSPEGIRQQPVTEAPKQKKVTVEDAENAVLAEIRAVNDSIAHEGLSAQIDRIGIITAKIFEYQKSHPEKSPQLHSFLSYYLPTTLKILRAYAQLESQGIEGENITAAKQRIEGMMDKVVEGFEKQLDQLFQGDALDITSDVKVLEQMLSKDGLSSGNGIRLSI